MSEFQHLLDCHNIDKAIVTETKLSEQSVASDVCVTSYITIRHDRNSAGGGVGIWAKSGPSIAELSYLNNLSLRSCGCLYRCNVVKI